MSQAIANETGRQLTQTAVGQAGQWHDQSACGSVFSLTACHTLKLARSCGGLCKAAHLPCCGVFFDVGHVAYLLLLVSGVLLWLGIILVSRGTAEDCVARAARLQGRLKYVLHQASLPQPGW